MILKKKNLDFILLTSSGVLKTTVML